MDAALAQLVWRRARGCREYCRMPQEYDEGTFEIDHIIALKHHGPTAPGNLALSCFHCNSFKGSNIGGRDPVTRKFTPLFNPRRHKWDRHFRWEGPHLIGKSAVGRVTIDLLNINHPFRVELRQELMEEGIYLS